jgi:hypothetical protein
MTPEDERTLQSVLVRGLAREKQMLSIEDEYYFEWDRHQIDAARRSPLTWSMDQLAGCLFDVHCHITDHRFWATKFFVHRKQDTPAFVRIPMGIRTTMEHAAKAIDFLHALHLRDKARLESFAGEITEPDLLKYYCFTHWVSVRLHESHRKVDSLQPFFVAGILAALVSEIPFDRADIWAFLRAYAEKQGLKVAQHMQFPHPSFVYPLLLHAAFRTPIDVSTVGLNDVDELVDSLLLELGLPELGELRLATQLLFESVLFLLNRSKMGRDLAPVLKWVHAYCANTTWVERIFAPLIRPLKQAPTPVVLNDGYYEGAVLSKKDADDLDWAAGRRNEMLQYLLTRDIVNDERSFLSTWLDAAVAEPHVKLPPRDERSSTT